MKGCILCRSEDIQIVGILSARQLIADWKKVFDIDIVSELKGYTHIQRYRCKDCGLEFFPPELAGSTQLYTKLQKFDWYYISYKWEHDTALQYIPQGARVLEVGCGQGAFVERLIWEKNCSALGIELNEDAVKTAQKKGLPVKAICLEDLCSDQIGTFDVVCHFQVLEHVPNPGVFLTNCIALLKPGGRLLIGVPNNDSFIRLDENALLNQPPHHLSRWNEQVFRKLTWLYDVDLMGVKFEPLAPYHLGWFIRVQLDEYCPKFYYYARVFILCLYGQFFRCSKGFHCTGDFEGTLFLWSISGNGNKVVCNYNTLRDPNWFY